jgi:hypothetical protein
MPVLPLDDASLQAEHLSMPALMRELNLQKKPFRLLVKLMNALEKKRQSQGLGWSRAWNKYGLTVFRTHTQHVDHAKADRARLMPLLALFLADAPAEYREFVDGVLNDPTRMSFTFYHNNTTADGRQYEGLTLSLGRRVPADTTKRDRLDIIIEDERRDGQVDGRVDRLRIYVCPWSTYGHDRIFHLCERSDLTGEQQRVAQDLFQHGVDTYNRDKSDESRQWSHWSVRYIDYFGPRTFIPQGSSFI